MNVIKNHMVVCPDVQRQIISRVLEWSKGKHPAQAVHYLGEFILPDGRATRLHVRHAVDAIIMDWLDQVVLIKRLFPPGVGLLATPGGMIEWVNEKVETDVEAALNEADQETKIGRDVLLAAQIALIGDRQYERPFDIREAWDDIPGTDIKKGDLFVVSTQAVRILVQGNLRDMHLEPADDAAPVEGEQPYELVHLISELTPEQFGAPDHLPMILAARAA